MALVEQLQAAGRGEEHPAPAWDLLPNPEQLQAEMTAVVEAHVRQQMTAMQLAAQPG